MKQIPLYSKSSKLELGPAQPQAVSFVLFKTKIWPYLGLGAKTWKTKGTLFPCNLNIGEKEAFHFGRAIWRNTRFGKTMSYMPEKVQTLWFRSFFWNLREHIRTIWDVLNPILLIHCVNRQWIFTGVHICRLNFLIFR